MRFVRSTHDEKGNYLHDDLTDDLKREYEIEAGQYSTAGFVAHMLFPDRPQTFNELVDRCWDYETRHEGGAHSKKDAIARGLVRCLEVGFAKGVE